MKHSVVQLQPRSRNLGMSQRCAVQTRRVAHTRGPSPSVQTSLCLDSKHITGPQQNEKCGAVEMCGSPSRGINCQRLHMEQNNPGSSSAIGTVTHSNTGVKVSCWHRLPPPSAESSYGIPAASVCPTPRSAEPL